MPDGEPDWVNACRDFDFDAEHHLPVWREITDLPDISDYQESRSVE